METTTPNNETAPAEESAVLRRVMPPCRCGARTFFWTEQGKACLGCFECYRTAGPHDCVDMALSEWTAVEEAAA